MTDDGLPTAREYLKVRDASRSRSQSAICGLRHDCTNASVPAERSVQR